MRAGANGGEAEGGQSPLISTRFLTLVTLIILCLAAASAAINWLGQSYGARLSLAGHSESTEILDIIIGRDRLALSANTIRFEQQRQPGITERVDLYLTWPNLSGYSTVQRRRFDDLGMAQSLIFLQLSQSTMSRDMSGRVEPIYQHLLEAGSEQGPNGLVTYRFRSGTGYDAESLLIGKLPDGETYAIRCLLPETPDDAGSSDCQRDIHVGQDLTVLYRFSSQLLGDWQAIDTAIRQYVESRDRPGTPAASLKISPKASTDHSS